MQNTIVSSIGALICFWIMIYYYFLWKKTKDFSKYHPALNVKKKVMTFTGMVSILAFLGFVFSIIRIFLPNLVNQFLV